MIFFGNTILCVDFQSTLFITLLRDSSWEAGGTGWEMYRNVVSTRDRQGMSNQRAMPPSRRAWMLQWCFGVSVVGSQWTNPTWVTSEDAKMKIQTLLPPFLSGYFCFGLLGWRRTLGSLLFWVNLLTPRGWMAPGSMQLFGMAEVGRILTKSCGNPPSGVIHGEMSVFL